jgi:hypothetical protein
MAGEAPYGDRDGRDPQRIDRQEAALEQNRPTPQRLSL